MNDFSTSFEQLKERVRRGLREAGRVARQGRGRDSGRGRLLRLEPRRRPDPGDRDPDRGEATATTSRWSTASPVSSTARVPAKQRSAGPTDEALVGAIAAIVAYHLRSERLDRLEDAVPELVCLALLPYLGFDGAKGWADTAASRDLETGRYVDVRQMWPQIAEFAALPLTSWSVSVLMDRTRGERFLSLAFPASYEVGAEVVPSPVGTTLIHADKAREGIPTFSGLSVFPFGQNAGVPDDLPVILFASAAELEAWLELEHGQAGGDLAEDRQEGLRRRERQLRGGGRARPLLRLDRRPGEALRRPPLPAALHAATAAEQVVAAQPRPGRGADRRRPDAARRGSPRSRRPRPTGAGTRPTSRRARPRSRPTSSAS